MVALLTPAAAAIYLQCLHTEVSGQGVYVGGLYIGAAIENSPFHAKREAARAAGAEVPEIPDVDPALLADMLWAMHSAKDPADATYPEGLLSAEQAVAETKLGRCPAP